MSKWVPQTMLIGLATIGLVTIGHVASANAEGLLPGKLFRLAQSTPSSDEPTPPAKGSPDEPTGADPAVKSVDEPGKSVDEPAKPGPTEEELSRKVEKPTSYGIGLQIRAHFIHEWFLGMFLDESTPLNSMAFGGEFIRRKGDLDIIGSVDFGFFGPKDGNYLGTNKNPATKTDYVQFRDFNILSFTAHFIWHHELTQWLSFVYGVGAGLGIVLGDMYRISNDPARCTRENAGDENQCFPRGVDPRTRDEDLQRLTGGVDDPNDPHLFKEDDVPPVIPMIHMLVGFNFKINEQFSVRLDGGFRNAFYIGTAGHWFF